MLRAAFTYSFVFSWWCGLAQVYQSARIEFPLERDNLNYEVISGQDHGLFLYRRIYAQPDDRLEIIKMDTALVQQWHGYIPVAHRYLLMAKRTEKERLYLLLRYQDYSHNDFILVDMAQKDGTYILHEIKNFIPFSPLEFHITTDAVVMGGYYNRVPVVVHFSLLTKKSKILPGLLNESGDLNQIKTYPDRSFDVIITARNSRGQKTTWIKNYDPNGELLRNQALDPEENKSLIFARSMKTTNNIQIIAGVFGSRNSEYSRGLFIATLDPSGLQQLRYYNFGDLSNFFKYMKVKREQRVRERIERRKIRGKKIRFSYRFLVHEIVPHNNQYILLGEAFSPQYKSIDGAYSGGFFNPYGFSGSRIQNGRIFDGYRYTHAVVIGFDPDGNIIWDNSFEINDVKTFTLEQFVKLEIRGDKIILLYLFENMLRSKIIKGNEVLEGKNVESIKMNAPTDIAVKENDKDSRLEYWYQDFFYAHGIQEISNAVSGKRRVLYITKLSYRE